jgi:hypothetical protein
VSYYQGDYMRGDFYRGDPGFFSFLGGLAKKAVGFIPGVGPALSAGVSMIHSPKAVTSIAKMGASKVMRSGVGRAIVKHPVLSAAGAAGAIGMMGAGAGAAIGRRGMVRAAAHRRRMNVCNPKALRRSIRRTQGFAKLAMRTIHIVHPKKKGRFGGFKKRRRAK